MLKLWGRANSVNVQKAILCLEELGLPYERVDAGMSHGVVRTDAYRAKNPNAVVPTLEDDGFVLWESNVIVRYLCATHGADGLWPRDAQARADVDRWMDWQQTTFNPPLTVLFWTLVRAPNDPPKGDLAAAAKSVDAAAALLESALGALDFVGGARLTMGDLALAPSVHRYMNMPMERAARPRLAAYHARLLARPAGAKALTLPLS